MILPFLGIPVKCFRIPRINASTMINGDLALYELTNFTRILNWYNESSDAISYLQYCISGYFPGWVGGRGKYFMVDWICNDSW